MSSFFDDLEDQLRAAARARAGSAGNRAGRPERRRRGWLRAGLGAAPVVAAVLVALVVVGAGLVLLGHRGSGGSPPQGSPPPGQSIGAIMTHTPQRQLHRELSYIAAATRGVISSKACRLQETSGPSYVHGAPGSDVLSILGVLRRPATRADRLDPGAMAGTPDIYRAYVRRAFSANGLSYYIVPARYDRAASIPSDRCFALQAAALERELPTLPAPLRQPTQKLQAALIAYDRGIAAHTPTDTICFVDARRNEFGSSCGITPKAIEEGQVGQNDQGTYSGVVPDGVATVTLTFPAASGQAAHAVTASVQGNVYAVRVGTAPGPTTPPTVIWRSSQGRVLKRISAPSAAAAAAACRQHPVECLALRTATAETSSAGSYGTGSARAAHAPGP